jgi:hypothetical protein
MKLLYQGMKKFKFFLWSEKVPFGYEKKPVFENFPFHTLGYENFGCFFLMKQNCNRLPFYMFPVVHYPVLLELEHSGWFHRSTSMMLHSLEYFQAKHYRTFHIHDCAEEWFTHNNPAISTLYADCKAAVPALCTHACFACDNTPHVLGFWTEHDAQIAYYSSAEQVREHLDKNTFMDFSMFVPGLGMGSSYLMLEHDEFGLAHVRYADGNVESTS